MRKTFDRTYWRCVSDKRLIEEARESGDELTIALGERLRDLRAEHEALRGEYDARANWQADA